MRHRSRSNAFCGYLCFRPRLILFGALPIGVEGGCQGGNPTIRQRPPADSFAFPACATIAIEQLCRHRGWSPGFEEWRCSSRRGVARRGDRQFASSGKRSWVGASDRKRSCTEHLRHLVPGTSLAVRRAGIPNLRSKFDSPWSGKTIPSPDLLDPDQDDTYLVSFQPCNLHFSFQICDDGKMCLRAL